MWACACVDAMRQCMLRVRATSRDGCVDACEGVGGEGYADGAPTRTSRNVQNTWIHCLLGRCFLICRVDRVHRTLNQLCNLLIEDARQSMKITQLLCLLAHREILLYFHAALCSQHM